MADKTLYMFFENFEDAMRMASAKDERGFDTTLNSAEFNDGVKGYMISWTPTAKSRAYDAEVVYNTFKQMQEKK